MKITRSFSSVADRIITFKQQVRNVGGYTASSPTIINLVWFFMCNTLVRCEWSTTPIHERLHNGIHQDWLNAVHRAQWHPITFGIDREVLPTDVEEQIECHDSDHHPARVDGDTQLCSVGVHQSVRWGYRIWTLVWYDISTTPEYYRPQIEFSGA